MQTEMINIDGFIMIEMQLALEYIAQGYIYKTIDDRYIVITNPEYLPDNGEDLFVVFDTANREFTDYCGQGTNSYRYIKETR